MTWCPCTEAKPQYNRASQSHETDKFEKTVSVFRQVDRGIHVCCSDGGYCLLDHGPTQPSFKEAEIAGESMRCSPRPGSRLVF